MSGPRPERAWATDQVLQGMDLLMRPETRQRIQALRATTGEAELAILKRLVRVGVQTEGLRQHWLARMRPLSPRLREAAMHLLAGRQYKGVAEAMGIAYWTAQGYCKEVARAFGESSEVGFWRRYALLLDVYGRDDLLPREGA